MKTSLFFNPTEEFVTWLADYAKGRLIIEGGCGEDMLLSKALADAGQKVVAFDPYLSEEAMLVLGRNFHFMPLPIEDSPLIRGEHPAGTLIVFARPCHSSFFQDTIRNAGKDVEILYIGLKNNIEVDYPDYWMVQELEAPATAEDLAIVKFAATNLAAKPKN